MEADGVLLPELERPCVGCGGEGVVPSLAWAEWRTRNPSVPGECFTRCNSGDPPPGGPREVGCGECGGVGTVPTEAGWRVLALVTKRGHQHSRDQYLYIGKRRGGLAAAVRDGVGPVVRDGVGPTGR